MSGKDKKDKENMANKADSSQAQKEVEDNYEDCAAQKEASGQPESEAQGDKSEYYINLAKRVQADFDNYRRRTREEQARLSTTVTGDVLKKFLPVLDNIDRALAHMEKDKNAGPYLEGFNLLKKGLEKVLADFGVKEMDAQGKAFDPHFHEALMEIQSDDVDKDTVSAVLQKGYMMGDAVLRPAKVQVAHN